MFALTRVQHPSATDCRGIVMKDRPQVAGFFKKTVIAVTGRSLPGHANISTTQRYMHLDDRELAEAQDLVE